MLLRTIYQFLLSPLGYFKADSDSIHQFVLTARLVPAVRASGYFVVTLTLITIQPTHALLPGILNVLQVWIEGMVDKLTDRNLGLGKMLSR